MSGPSKLRKRKSAPNPSKKSLKTSHDARRRPPQKPSSPLPHELRIEAGLTVEKGQTLSASVLEAIADSVTIQDTDLRIIYQNKVSKNIFGDCLGENCYRAYHKNDRVCEQCALVESFKDGKIHTIERTGKNEMGVLHFEVTAAPLRNAAGAIIAGIEIGRNITERKRAEEAIRASKEILEKTFRSLDSAIFILDNSNPPVITDCNPAATKIFGYEKEEVLQHSTEFLHADKKALSEFQKKNYSAIDEKGFLSSFEFRMKRKNGEIFPSEHSVFPLGDDHGNRIGWVSFIKDITERKRAEVEQQKLVSIIENTPDFVGIADINCRVLYINDAGRRLVGIDGIDAVKRTSIEDYVRPEDRQKLREEMLASIFSKGQWIGETLLRNFKTGMLIPVEMNSFLINDRKTGQPIAIATVTRDITVRQRSEREHTRLLNVLERSLNEIYMFDAETLQFRYVNSSALRNLGYSRGQIESMTPLDIKPEFTAASFRETIEPLLNRRKGKQIFSTVHRRADGTLYPVEVHLQLVEHEQERMFLAVIIDITDRMRAEEDKQKLHSQLLQAQKMEAVGQLAGGIAHDFNNILTAIIGYGNLVSMKTANDEAHRPFIDQILSAANRAASLTQGLLAFSRKQIINPQPVSVNSIIEQVQKLLNRIIGEDIELKTVLTGDDTTVFADTGQIEQVLINLATNARDAMPNGGQLTIETRLAEIGSEYIRTHGYGKAGKYVLISVTDSGDGMDEKTRERIFEPFFTTKEVGKGTGLGLAIVYGSVKQQNGYINVYSERGRGTTFTVYLPLLKDEVRPATVEEPAPPPKGGTETILLAEDDTALRDLARGMLEEFGYTVIEAVDGREAIEKFGMLKDRIQLLILDVIMPNKNGRQVFEEAKKIKPGIKALFTSGYPAHIIQKKGILEPGINFIVKPHPPQELLKKVREVLDT